MKLFTFVLTTLTMSACSKSAERAPSAGSGSAGSASQPRDAMAAVGQDAQTLKQHMREHFSAISDLQRAIARGHHDQAKQDARWIVEHQEADQLGASAPFVDAMKRAAAELAAATDLPNAAAIAPRLVRTCSNCHESSNAVVTFAWEQAPPDAADLPAQMKRHQWAAARLWEGLVGPSEALWQEGAATLATTRMDGRAASGNGAPRGDVAALAKHVRELAVQASKTAGLDARATLYGELLSTCAGCHQLVRPAPVPGP